MGNSSRAVVEFSVFSVVVACLLGTRSVNCRLNPVRTGYRSQPGSVALKIWILPK